HESEKLQTFWTRSCAKTKRWSRMNDSISIRPALSTPFARHSRRLLSGTAVVAFSPAVVTLTADTALAATDPMSVGLFEVVQLAVSIGVIGAALLSAIWLIRERRRTSEENTLLRGKVADLGAALQRSEAMLNLRDQRVVVWSSDHKKPELIGTLPIESGAPEE